MTTTATSSSATTAPSISPSDNLANSAGTSFCLFNSDWLSLQNFVASALALPINTPNFTATYGAFTDMTEVQTCVNNLSTIAGLATTMGNPTELQAKIQADPGYVSGTTIPAELYAQCIWLAGQLQQTASSMSSNYANLSYLFTGTQQEITNNIIDFLTGSGGMVSMAQSMLASVNSVQTNLSNFQATLKPAADAVTTYFNTQNNVLQVAQTDYNNDVSSIQTLQAQADKAHTAWRNYTIEATTISIGLTILTAGLLWPVGAGVGIGLGVEAQKELDLYNNLMQQIATTTADEQMKNRLIIDLSSFNSQVASVDTSLTSFLAELAKIQGVWTDQITSLTAAANYCTTHNFSTYTEMASKMNILDVQNDWQNIANLTSQFTTNCLVNYLNTVQYPQQLPGSLVNATTVPSAN